VSVYYYRPNLWLWHGHRGDVVCTAERGEVTSSRDVGMSTIPQMRPLTTGSDVTPTKHGGGDEAEAEEDEEEPSLCWKKDAAEARSTSST